MKPREYTQCLECQAVFPSCLEVVSLDKDEHKCPVCGDAGIASIEDVDVEVVVVVVMNAVEKDGEYHASL